MTRGVDLAVQGAEKRDAGRGIARLSNATMQTLGVLSGDTIVVEGARDTVAKVWPGGEDGVLKIDAGTRQNASVKIGDTVTVREQDVDEADSVMVSLPNTPEVTNADLADYVKRTLLQRPIQIGDTVALNDSGTEARVESTSPETTVQVVDDTRVTVQTGSRQLKSSQGSSGGRRGDSGRSGGRQSGSSTGGSESVEEALGGQGARPTTGGPKTDVAYEDIGGLDEELELIREMVELPLSEPDLFRRLGVDPPRGVLLHGPPGTGKTLIAKAVANEVSANFFTISGPEVVSKYKGDSEEKIREKFAEARQNSPAILFIDEIDSIAGERDDDADMENRVVAQLLTELDGMSGREEVIVIGATNRVDSIDPALRRGGRFDREIEIGVPNEEGRREILDVHTLGMPIDDDVDLDRLAERTHGFVGADIRTLSTEAAMSALRRYRHERESDPDTPLTVSRSDFEAAMAAVDPSAMREYVVETTNTTFEDVGGLDEAKATLRESVIWPLSYENLFEATNTNPPTGILLYGPPGTGKTLLARAIAGESGVNFIHVAGPELIDKYVGESEKAVREVFDRARQTAPTIVFFDEVDAIAAARGGEQDVTERVVSQLLTELDGLASNPNLVVLAATNRYEAIDPALLRPGRFESHVEVPLPDEEARRLILSVHTEGKPLDEDIDIDELAAETEGYSGADLEALVRQASLFAIRAMATDVGPEAANERADEIRIGREHFEDARSKVEPPGSGR
ncbi:AAA family ATPase [Halomarina oriensis]|uniref:AAA family ATPase n=1 Tax=Halomarina oriensis TaxID=671145 RepID=A0A6B0GMJ5_9EURY|nr:AAA family ATPase [Halomarina oriensis]MWG33943.1 AAA family ATPase [Halomarina oriensis]